MSSQTLYIIKSANRRRQITSFRSICENRLNPLEPRAPSFLRVEKSHCSTAQPFYPENYPRLFHSESPSQSRWAFFVIYVHRATFVRKTYSSRGFSTPLTPFGRKRLREWGRGTFAALGYLSFGPQKSNK